MKIIENFLVFLVLMQFYIVLVYATIHARVINELGEGRCIIVHCQSKDDDLGYINLDNGSEFQWSFNINFWGTTLFFCDLQWKDSFAIHFNAFDANKDYNKCVTECKWLINSNEILFRYSQEVEKWEPSPFSVVPSMREEKNTTHGHVK
uniref:S-protein homolog n=1 Tax=Manihot esculenta TaxID=3983 RepID=A0A2C9UV39_MANES